MSNLTDTLRELPMGETHSILKRVAVKKYDVPTAQEDLRKMNNNVGVIAGRVGGLKVERIIIISNDGDSIFYGVAVTRESKS